MTITWRSKAERIHEVGAQLSHTHDALPQYTIKRDMHGFNERLGNRRCLIIESNWPLLISQQTILMHYFKKHMFSSPSHRA